MPKKRFRTPQEKKRLSYQKDRRNVYGNSTTAARKSIPAQKKFANRQVRRVAKVTRDDDLDTFEASVVLKAKRRWRKYPDAPLGELVPNKIEQRKAHHGRRKKRLKLWKEGQDA